MTAANIQIKKILVGRGNTAVASTYDGVRGELVLDTGLNTLRVYDGTTTGGTVLATSQQVATIANLVANSAIQVGNTPPVTSTTGTLWYDSEGGRTYIRYANTWVDASPSVTNVSIVDLTANVAEIQTNFEQLGVALNDILGTFEGNIVTLTSNAQTLTTNFNAYKTYANANAATITSNFNAYKTYANNSIARLDANVGRILLYELGTGSGANVTVDTTPPIVNRTGSLWWDTEDGRLYLRYNNAWVDASPTVSSGTGVGNSWLTGSGLAPAPGTNPGDQYLDADTGNVYQWDGETWILSGNIKGPAGGGGGTVWTNNANGCLRAELSATGFQAFTDATHLDLQDSGQWTIGSYQYGTFIGNDEFTNVNILSLRSGDDTYITTNLRENGNHQWKFGTDGNLTFPNGDLTIGHDPYGDPAIIGAAGKNIAMIASGVGDGYEIGSSLIWVDSITEPTKIAGVTANNPLFAGAGDVGIVTGDYLYTGNTNVWNFGANGTLTVPGAITMPDETGLYSPGHDLYITAGNTTGCSVPGGDTIISSGLGYGGAANNGGNVTLRTGDYYNKIWNFDYNGALTIPGSIISTAGPAITFATTFDGNIAPEIHIKASKLTFIADSAYLNDIVDNTMPFNGVPAMSWNMEGEVLTWTANNEIFASTSIFKMPHSDSANVGVIAMTGPSGGSELSWHGGTDYGRPIGQFIKSSANVSISTNGGFKWWIFGDDGNLTIPAGGNLVTSTGSLHTISLDLLKSIVASSGSWGEFQANIAAL